jgi:hypothetical protein
MTNKLIIDAQYNLKTKDGQLQVGISDGENDAIVHDNGALRTEDLSTFSFLNKMLKELKIMNFHLSLITDEEITHQEFE